MGGWMLEIGRMAMYMTFPVALFHLFNQPRYFEEWVTKTKREIYPPENLGHREQIENAIKVFREKQDERITRALEEIERKEASVN